MGQNLSSPLPQLSTDSFMAVSIFRGDAIVLFYAGNDEIEAVRNAITEKWKKGIEHEKYRLNHQDSKNCYEFKLKGNPFLEKRRSSWQRHNIQCRKMFTAMFKGLDILGWNLLITTDVSLALTRSTCVFQRQQEKQITPTLDASFFNIGLVYGDLLEVNGCPEELHQPIKDACNEWLAGIQNEKKFKETYEIKLRKNPWKVKLKSDSCHARKMVCGVIEKLSTREYQLHGTCNFTGKTDTLYFKHNPLQTPQIEQYLILSLNSNDLIRLMNVPDNICNSIKKTVEQHWPKGLQDQTADKVCYELKLNGKPWLHNGQEEEIDAKRLLSRIMETMTSFGFYIATSLNVSRKDNDKSVFIFHRGKEPLHTTFMCISLHSDNKIKFVDAPDDIIDAGRKVIERHYSSIGHHEEKSHLYGVSYKTTLNGRPWNGFGKTGIHGKAMLIGLISEFHSLRWQFVCSAKVTATLNRSQRKRESQTKSQTKTAHSLWLMHEK